MKLSLRPLQRADILVYDLNSSPLAELLPARATFWLATRKEVLHVHLKVLYPWFIFLLKTRNLRLSYVIAVIEAVKPKLVVTYIDTDRTFHEAASYYPEAQFFAVQNSFRYPNLCSLLLPNSKYESTMLCFGENEKTEYKKNKIVFRNVCVIGNIKSDELLVQIQPAWRQGSSLRLISDGLSFFWTPIVGSRSFTLEEFIAQSGLSTQNDVIRALESIPQDIRVDDVALIRFPLAQRCYAWSLLTFMAWIREFCQRNKLEEVQVLLRSNYDSREKEFFRKYGESDWTLLSPSDFRKEHNSSGKHLYISQRSTMGLDLLGAGRKIMFAQLGITQPEIRSVDASWWLVNPAKEVFMSTLTELLALEEGEFHNRFKDSISYYLARNPEGPSRTVSRLLEAALLKV